MVDKLLKETCLVQRHALMTNFLVLLIFFLEVSTYHCPKSH